MEFFGGYSWIASRTTKSWGSLVLGCDEQIGEVNGEAGQGVNWNMASNQCRDNQEVRARKDRVWKGWTGSCGLQTMHFISLILTKLMSRGQGWAHGKPVTASSYCGLCPDIVSPTNALPGFSGPRAARTGQIQLSRESFVGRTLSSRQTPPLPSALSVAHLWFIHIPGGCTV